MNGLYTCMRGLIGLALGFYFRRIERFHAERVPATGPVLFVSNHPSSLNDSFVIGVSVGRKVNFVATVQLFRFPPLKWLLRHCGVVPVNRFKDDPRAMRSVMDTFEACFHVLERGEAVGIFPEGITHDDPQLKEVKSGAARMALELEHRHGGKLGLQIVPVGLTFSAKEIYRSEALVHFGGPIRVAEFLTGYETERKECIRRLTHEIEARLQNLILHLPQLEHARVVTAVQRLYLDRLRVGNRVIHEPVPRQVEDLLLTQAIARAVELAFVQYPERAAAFVTKLDFYERWLKRLKVSDDALAEFPHPGRLLGRTLLRSLLAILGAPVALYGWIHRFIPVRLVRYGVKLTEPAKRKAQTPHAKMIGGILAFAPCYLLYAVIFHQFFGWPASLWYGLSLPVGGLMAYYYIRNLRRLGAAIRNTTILIRAHLAARRLLRLRSELIAEIEALRPELQSHFQPSTNP
jgi:1-acyl-sn-glycerol-3-phosphate acyltransferase